MSRAFTIEALSSFEALERKLSMSSMAMGTTVAGDDLPPPGPEPDPGPMPTDDPPIVYPPIQGAHAVSTF
jgi:hypothetical protein